jgi:hypothetical protein
MRVVRELLFQVICSACVSAIATAQNPPSTHWCAKPRPHEPLLRDAQGLRDPNNREWATRRYVFKIPLVRDAQVAVVSDEATCRAGAEAYADHMRGIFGAGWPAKPVLVIRVGELYLVDDQGPRDGKSAVWYALVVDKAWQTLVEYGGGS